LFLLLLMLHLLMPHQLALLYCVERTHKTILFKQKVPLFGFFLFPQHFVMAGQLQGAHPCHATRG
jgi:hypothetical protein